MALSQSNSAVSDEYFQELAGELDWVIELRSAMEPIPLDDTAAYASDMRFVHIADADAERWHVKEQLEIIFEHLNIEVPDNYFESRSNTELKYDLYDHLTIDVLPFLDSNEMADQSRIADFLQEYHDIARDIPRNVVSKLQGSYQNPDVLGFYFTMGIMGLSIAFEPIDWGLTFVDVIDVLSKGDKKSAALHLLLGAAPLLKSGMVDVGQSFLNRFDNVRLLPARAGLPRRHVLRNRGFTDEMIDAIELRGATGPGTGSHIHRRWEELGLESRSAVTLHGKNPGTKIQDENDRILNERYGFNIVNEPGKNQLKEIGFYDRTTLDGGPISSQRTPDYIIEGRDFDSYQVGANDIESVPPEIAIRRIWDTIEDKVPDQTNGLVIDLSKTSLTAERFIIDELSTYSQPKLGGLREIIFMDNGEFAGNWVNPQG